MKELRTIKPIPGIPVGTVLKTHDEFREGYFYYYSNMDRCFTEKELEGFVEEVKEPEEFWFIHHSGEIQRHSTEYDTSVAKEFRFQTKESAEKFAKALKEMPKYELEFSGKSGMMNLANIIEALNDRVK